MKHTPLESRLARAGRRSDLRLLQDYAAPHVPSAWFAANDNEVASTQVDRIVEIRPSPDEVVRIAAQDAIKTRDGYGPITPAELDVAARRNIKVEGGRIVKWKGSDSRWHDAAELFRQPKGGRRKTDEEHLADNARHLAIPATGKFPERSTYIECGSEGEDYRRHRAMRWVAAMTAYDDNRRVGIDRLGVGGRHTFCEARSNAGLAPAERCPAGIARGVQFMGYRVHRNPRATQGSFVGALDAVENAIVAQMGAPQVRSSLGEHFAVLESSLDGMTARAIAAANGWGTGKAGERKAVRVQDLALEALAKLAA